MRSMKNEALLEEVKGLIEDIDALFEEYGFSPEDFDPDMGLFPDIPDLEIAKFYSHIHNLKTEID